MANIFCPNPPNPCLDPTIPTANFSSEAPDQDLFIGNDYDGGDWPPLDPRWRKAWCHGVCESTVSQADADLCAAIRALECVRNPPDDPGDPPTPIFFSDTQTCTRTCPDGLEFTYVVAAAAFASLWNQADANAKAFSYACRQAELNRVCLGTLAAQACSEVFYSSTITIQSGGHFPVSASVVSGTLPDGLELTYTNASFTISGIPTTPGNYSFTIRVQDSAGNFMEKPYTICVIDIRWDSEPYGTPLEDAALAENYQITFNAPACATAPLSWQVTSGSLPPGMALDEETGVLGGSPTETGEFTFTVTLQTSAT